MCGIKNKPTSEPCPKLVQTTGTSILCEHFERKGNLASLLFSGVILFKILQNL